MKRILAEGSYFRQLVRVADRAALKRKRQRPEEQRQERERKRQRKSGGRTKEIRRLSGGVAEANFKGDVEQVVGTRDL